MNKTDLINSAADRALISKREAGEAVDAVLASITRALAAGDAVTLVGFGTFLVKDKPSRAGRNPKTGEVLQIEAKRVPYFSAGKLLKDAIANPPVVD